MLNTHMRALSFCIDNLDTASLSALSRCDKDFENEINSVAAECNLRLVTIVGCSKERAHDMCGFMEP
jgi:hypothetical protein